MEDNIVTLGCWSDRGNRAISGGIRLRSDNPIEDCFNFARQLGYKVFAVEYGKECFTAMDADKTYMKYGKSEKCKDGRGGGWSFNAYKIKESTEKVEDNITSLGCWGDSSRNRAISGGMRLSSSNPIEDCYNYARKFGFTVFAVEYGKECYTSIDADKTYMKHGKSDKCWGGGRGGSGSFNVYEIKESAKKVEYLGCWTDANDRAIEGGVRFISDSPMEDCYKLAKKFGWRVFAVENYKNCQTASDADETYKKYGKSDKCKDNGRGGVWSYNAYRIIGNFEFNCQVMLLYKRISSNVPLVLHMNR